MTSNAEELDLQDRLKLIETMIAEGRRSTESWGWVFLLWSVTYFVAIAWSAWGNHASQAWNITVTGAMILAVGAVAWRISRRKQRSQPATHLGRAVTAVWLAVGIAMAVLIPSLTMGGLSSSKLVVAVIGTLLGTANAASSIILKWKLQFVCAVIWWALAVISCVGDKSQSFVGLLIANFFCQIVFGIYGMIAEARERRQGAVHA